MTRWKMAGLLEDAADPCRGGVREGGPALCASVADARLAVALADHLECRPGC
jgi:hypothetical protein